mgnify:CR=1 FL=1
MIAIGNGEKCPFCDLVMNDHLIDKKDSFNHLITMHEEEMMTALFPEKKNAHPEGSSPPDDCMITYRDPGDEND